MNEIEVKILETSHKDLEERLFKLGAKKVFEGELSAAFFDTKDSTIKQSDQVFRLRKEGDKTYLTHKKKLPSNGIKICDETEIEVSSYEDTRKILLATGFKETRNTRKNRVSYKLDNTKFEFDTFLEDQSFVPEFLEIEAQNIEDIHKYAKLLGFKEEDCKPWGAKEILAHYSK